MAETDDVPTTREGETTPEEGKTTEGQEERVSEKSSGVQWRYVLLTLLFIALCYGAYRGYQVFFATEEDRVAEVIHEMGRAASEGKAEGVTKHLTSDYRDEQGMNKVWLTNLLKHFFYQRKKGIEIRFHQIDVKLSPGKKEAKVFVEASRVKKAFEKNARPEFKAELKMVKSKKDGRWRIQSASYNEYQF